MTLLEKIQKLPENRRKTILWTTILILALLMLFWYWQTTKEVIKTPVDKLWEKELKIPRLQSTINDFSKPLQEQKENVEEAKNSLQDVLKMFNEELEKSDVIQNAEPGAETGENNEPEQQDNNSEQK